MDEADETYRESDQAIARCDGVPHLVVAVRNLVVQQLGSYLGTAAVALTHSEGQFVPLSDIRRDALVHSTRLG